jgi:ribose 5-phosphate isomerase B
MSFNEDELAALVRQVVTRTMGDRPRKNILGEDTLRKLPPGISYTVPAGTIVTPLARQIALEKSITLLEGSTAGTSDSDYKPADNVSALSPGDPGRQIVAFGADHGGYELKEMLKVATSEAGFGLVDCGTNSKESVDYPDFAYAVARLVADGQAWRGIIVDGAGIGSCMAANKVPSIRAALCYDQATAVNSREHNNANVLTLGAGLIGPSLAKQIVITWLATPFGGGRHARRVDKINAIGDRFMKK